MRPARLVFALFLSVLVAVGPPLQVAAQPDRDEIAAIQARVAELRSLEPQAEVPVVVLTRSEFTERLRRQVASAEAWAEITTTQKLLRLLGLIPAGLDLAELQVEVLGSQVLGAYNSGTKEITLINGSESAAQTKVTLAHELVHLLQDQHFDLPQLQATEPRNSDHNLAVQALVEGDASLTSGIYAVLSLSPEELKELRGASELGAPQEADAPNVLREELRFVYLGGGTFVQGLLTESGWGGVNAAYSQPPQSTEQVLHPQKYLAQEAPTIPKLGDAAEALGPGWHQLREDTLGELGLRLALGEFVPIFVAADAGAGWGGDRFQLLERAEDGFLALVVSSDWDSPNDARQFYSAYSEVVAERYGRGAVLRQQQPGLRIWNTPDGVVWLQAQEQRVLLAIGPELRHAEALVGVASGE